VADSLPVGEAIRRGACRIMVIRSRPRNYVKRSGLSECFMRWYVRHDPCLHQTMTRRVQRYNETVAFIRNPPEGVSIVEICPPANFRASRIGRDRLVLEEGYEQGRALAVEAIALWKATC